MIAVANTITMSEAIEKAYAQEQLCKDILVPRNRTLLNPNFTVSTAPRVEGKPGLKLMDQSLKQMVRTAVGMPSKAVDWFRANNLGTEMAQCYNKLAPTLGDSKLKYRIYSPETLETTCYGVVTENYNEFLKSHIMEAIRLGASEYVDPKNLVIGIEGMRGNGRFGETVINPWELDICIPLMQFEGPRGDTYIAGVHIRERGDGTGSCHIEAFLLRVKCWNGMTESKWSHTVSIAHRGKNAFGTLQQSIHRGIGLVARNVHTFQQSIGMLPTIELENPFAALVAVAEKDLGERRLAQARQILDMYIREMGSNADAVVNTITHVGTQDRVDSAREAAQALGGKLLAMKPEQWLRAEARGLDIVANKFSIN